MPTTPLPETRDGKKRRWPQFRLRTLLIVFAVLCVYLGYLTERWRQDAEIAARLRERGCVVFYDSELDGRGAPFFFISANEVTPWVKELLRIQGPDTGESKAFRFVRRALTLDFVFPCVRRVWIGQGVLMPEIAEDLRRLRQLRWLDLEGSSVTGVEAEQLRKQLPQCDVGWWEPITQRLVVKDD